MGVELGGVGSVTTGGADGRAVAGLLIPGLVEAGGRSFLMRTWGNWLFIIWAWFRTMFLWVSDPKVIIRGREAVECGRWNQYASWIVTEDKRG